MAHSDEITVYVNKELLNYKNLLGKKLKIALDALSHYELHDLYEPIVGKEIDEKTARFAHELGDIARKAIKQIEELDKN